MLVKESLSKHVTFSVMQMKFSLKLALSMKEKYVDFLIR